MSVGNVGYLWDVRFVSIKEATRTMWWRRLVLTEQRMERGMYSRASGECVCEVCHRQYWRHPYMGEYACHLLCDGSLVHL